MSKRFATKKDVDAGHKFRAVSIQVDRGNILIRSDETDIVPNIIGKDGVYRFGARGAIENVELGKVHLRSASEYNCTAFIIDYSGNLQHSVVQAKEYAEQTRQSYLTRLRKHIAELEATSIVVQ